MNGSVLSHDSGTPSLNFVQGPESLGHHRWQFSPGVMEGTVIPPLPHSSSPCSHKEAEVGCMLVGAPSSSQVPDQYHRSSVTAGSTTHCLSLGYRTTVSGYGWRWWRPCQRSRGGLHAWGAASSLPSLQPMAQAQYGWKRRHAHWVYSPPGWHRLQLCCIRKSATILLPICHCGCPQ